MIVGTDVRAVISMISWWAHYNKTVICLNNNSVVMITKNKTKKISERQRQRQAGGFDLIALTMTLICHQ